MERRGRTRTAVYWLRRPCFGDLRRQLILWYSL